MIGTEKQIAYATKMRPVAVRVMAGLAADLQEAIEDGIDPKWAAHEGTLKELLQAVQAAAEKVKTTDDAAYILNHKDSSLKGIMYEEGFYDRLPTDLTYVLGHIG